MVTQHLPKRTAARLAAAATRGQSRRLIEYLDQRGTPVLTGELAAAIAASNISFVAIKANRELERHGYRIVCRLPKPLTKNRFGESSQAHEWSIERVC